VVGAIFDSSPANLHWNIALRSMNIAMPNRLAFYSVATLFSCMYLVKYAQYKLGFKGKDLFEVSFTFCYFAISIPS